ncbi:Long-chain-fatty-acid--CoA ligase FadD15 [Luteitalea pratensis]|uniref:Long-chain-fatty-acid--CoA ligase FadD15 n=1 Tax=Luteitalea pratensis TaxID=1855912 RepID=A0A143PMT2_LUTPR|nr:long-chain fatty acid--CoA ligase [Luteitalea pratensis]AMY09791.1 Long-chain-fatty-acid--CoA ligase FadD15 [Luteitalea pratensis]
MPTAVASQRRPYRFPPAVTSRLRSLAQLPADLLREHPRPDLLQQCTSAGLRPCATDAFVERVRATGLALADMGLQPGDRVAIMSETRQEWIVADMGIVTARLVTAPIYPTLSGLQARFILQDSGARGVFVSDVAQAEKILAVRHLLPALEFIVVFTDEVPPAAVRGSHTVLRLEGLIERGRALASDPLAVARYEAGIDAVAPDDLFTIIYTSGTTGEPKGVMLTHDNVLSNIAAVIPVLELDSGDVALSYLPLSHVFERMVTYLYLYEGLTVCHAESLDTLARDLQLVQPTVMTGVPRVYEKLHTKIHETVAAGPAFRRRLFDWAVRIGIDASAARHEGRALSPFLKMQEAVADGLVASKIRAKVGGRLRLAVSGSAPLPAHIARFFHAVGVPLIEGYGLTETSPVITVNPRDRPRFGSVGCVVDGVEVAIAEDGEILTRGPHVMKGYWNRPDETAAALSQGGWFHTGDIGTLGDDGFLTITDRKKELLVTSGGKKIAPAPIEALLKRHPLVAEAMIVGEARKFPAVLIVPNFTALEQRLKVLGLPSGSREELVTREDVVSLFHEVVEPLNRDLAQFERLKKLALLPAEFSIATGELTPTLKLRRRVVLERWHGVVERLYEQA